MDTLIVNKNKGTQIMYMIINKKKWTDEYHTSEEMNQHIQAIADALSLETTIQSVSKEDHYNSRILGFISLMLKANKSGLSCGWSKQDHPDNGGETCFGGGWAVCWIVTPQNNRVAYHISLQWMDGKEVQYLEQDHATFWNGKDDTIKGLKQIQTHLKRTRVYNIIP